MVSFNGGEPFEVEGLQLVMEPAAVGGGPSIPAGSLTLDPMSFTVSGEFHGWFEQLLRDLPEARERRAAAHRRAWSGPDQVERQILRAFGVSAGQIGTAPRSAFSSAFRQRQRNRVKRRRR